MNPDGGDLKKMNAEDKLLNSLSIKCKECNAIMSPGRQDGHRYYYCRNNGGHEDNLDRVVWVNMPPYLESDSRDLDIELSSKQETNKDSKN